MPIKNLEQQFIWLYKNSLLFKCPLESLWQPTLTDVYITLCKINKSFFIENQDVKVKALDRLGRIRELLHQRTGRYSLYCISCEKIESCFAKIESCFANPETKIAKAAPNEARQWILDYFMRHLLINTNWYYLPCTCYL